MQEWCIDSTNLSQRSVSIPKKIYVNKYKVNKQEIYMETEEVRIKSVCRNLDWSPFGDLIITENN